MQAFYGTRISDHLSQTPEGFLVCHGVPCARTGPLQYRGRELGLPTDDPVTVYRDAREVFAPAAMASLTGKPVVGPGHPPTFLTPANATAYARGHAMNPRRGTRLPDGNWPLVADLVITDASLISQIKSGLRECSVGYNFNLIPRRDGSFEQVAIRANHVAIVPSGRAGEYVRIMDADPTSNERSNGMTDEERESRLDRLCDLFEQYLEAQLKTQRSEDVIPDPDVSEEARVALDALLKLRPFVEWSGDREALASYRGAVREMRRYASADARPLPPMGAGRDEGPDFAAEARRFHRKHPQGVKADEEQEERSAQDAAGGELTHAQMARRFFRRDIREVQNESAASADYASTIRRARERMLAEGKKGRR